MQLLNEGEEVTLMDWGNAIVQTISKSADGKAITGMHRFCAQAYTHLGFFESWKQLFLLPDKNEASAGLCC